jgi:hypothetical protein
VFPVLPARKMMIAAIQLSVAAKEFVCLAIFASKGQNHLQIFVIMGLNVCQDVVQTIFVRLLPTVSRAVVPTVIAAKIHAALKAFVRVQLIVKIA